MYILHVNSFYNFHGGAELTTNKQISIAEQNGHRAGIIYFCDDDQSAKPFAPENRFIKKLTISAPNKTINEQLIETIRKEKPDIVNYHNLWPHNDLIFDEKLQDLGKSILCEHSSTLTCLGRNRFHKIFIKPCFMNLGLKCILLPPLTKCVYFRNPILLAQRLKKYRKLPHIWSKTFILAQSELIEKFLINTGFKKNKITVIPNYVDIPDHWTNPSGRKILFVGRLEIEKGMQDILHAIVDIDCELRICGTGTYISEINSLIRTLNIQNKVTFLGKLGEDALNKEYEGSALVVFPSRWLESCSNVVLEAMAHARPLVAYDSGGVRFLIKNNLNGFIIPCGRKDLLKYKIINILDNPQLATQMGQNGRAICEKKFTYDIYSRNLIKFYETVTSS